MKSLLVGLEPDFLLTTGKEKWTSGWISFVILTHELHTPQESVSLGCWHIRNWVHANAMDKWPLPSAPENNWACGIEPDANWWVSCFFNAFLPWTSWNFMTKSKVGFRLVSGASCWQILLRSKKPFNPCVLPPKSCILHYIFSYGFQKALGTI